MSDNTNCDTFNEASSSFLAWFKSQPGATIHPSLAIKDLRDRGAGRGVIATEDIPADTDLFTIPRSSLLSVENSDLHRRLPDLFNSAGLDQDDEDEDEHEQATSNNDATSDLPPSWLNLILVLLYELLQSSRSRWYPYLSILPSTPSKFSTPIFWDQTDLKELQASPLLSKIGRETADVIFRGKMLPVVKRHAAVFYGAGIDSGSGHLSDEEVVEKCHVVASLIMAYSFNLHADDDSDPDSDASSENNDDNQDGWTEDKDHSMNDSTGDTETNTMGMIPLADLLNADAEFNAHLSHNPDSLTMTSLRLIPAGQEVLNYYGPLPTSELLRRYGYTSPKHARYDIVDVSWDAVRRAVGGVARETLGADGEGMEKVDEVFSRIERGELEGVDVDVSSGFTIERDSGDPNEEGLCTYPARFVAFPEDLVEVVRDVVVHFDETWSKNLKKGQDVKARVLLILEGVVRVLREAYDTSISEDEEILKRADLKERMRMAVEVRLGEKRLLKEADGWCQEKLEKYREKESGSKNGNEKEKRRTEGVGKGANGRPPTKKVKKGR